MAGEITFQQMTQTQFIMGVISKLRGPTQLFTNFFRMGLNSPGTFSPSRTWSWDIFNDTRQVGKFAGTGTGPTKITRQRTGTQSAAMLRAFFGTDLLLEELFRSRPLGGQIGTVNQGVDPNGMQYFRSQINFIRQNMMNLVEYTVATMLQSGFGYSFQGKDILPVPSTSASAHYTIDPGIPASHKDGAAMGSGADIIDVTWDDPTADVPAQLWKINEYLGYACGRPLRHIFLRGRTMSALMKNVHLRSQGGYAYTVFESLTANELQRDNLPSTGYDVKFAALPLFTFHVYDDGVILPTTGGSSVDETDPANITALIPSNKAILCPEPSSDWFDMAVGQEPIVKQLGGPYTEVRGFDIWVRPPFDNPPSAEIQAINNWLPFLKVPKAVVFPTVMSTTTTP